MDHRRAFDCWDCDHSSDRAAMGHTKAGEKGEGVMSFEDKINQIKEIRT